MANTGSETGFRPLFDVHFPQHITALKEPRKTTQELEALTEKPDGTVSANLVHLEAQAGDYTLDQFYDGDVVFLPEHAIQPSCNEFLTHLVSSTENILRLIRKLVEDIELLATQQLTSGSLNERATLEFFAAALDIITQCHALASRSVPNNIGGDIGDILLDLCGVLDDAGLNRGVRPLLGCVSHRMEDIIVIWDHHTINEECFNLESALACRQDEFAVMMRHLFPHAVEVELSMMSCYKSYLETTRNCEAVVDGTLGSAGRKEYLIVGAACRKAGRIQEEVFKLELPKELSAFQYQMLLVLAGRMEYLDEVLNGVLASYSHTHTPPDSPPPCPDLSGEGMLPIEELERTLVVAVATMR